MNGLRIWCWFSLRRFRLQPWRTLAVLLGVGLGAAVFTSVRLAVGASVESFNRNMDQVAGKADLRVVRPGGRVDEALTGALLRSPAVAAASPVISAYVQPTAGGEPFRLIGLDPLLDRPLRPDSGSASPGRDQPTGQEWMKLMSQPWTLLAGQALAERHGLAPGGGMDLESPAGGAVPFTVLGTLPPGGLSEAEGGLVAVADIATVQELLDAHGVVDRIDVILRPGADPADVQALLPPGTVAEKPSEVRESGLGMIRAYETNLTVLSFASLFVGMFLIYSLVSLNAAARRHELAVLRSLGATSRFVFAAFLADGALLGLLGWLLAIPAGAFLVRGLTRGVSTTVTSLFSTVHADRILLSPLEIAASLCLTLVVSMLAAAQPARRAMAVEPREALLMPSAESTEAEDRGPGPARHVALAGLACLALVKPLLALPGLPGMPLPGYAAIFLLFTGFSLLAPWLLGILAGSGTGRGLTRVLRRLGGWPAFLAGRFVRASGPRAAVSVGALITAMALFVALAIMIHSFRQTFSVWLRESVSGDVFIRPAMAEENEYREPMPEPVKAWIEGRRDLDALPYARLYLRQGSFPYQLEPLDVDVYARHASFLFLAAKGGDEAGAVASLRAGTGALVSETFANKTGLGLGDHVRATARGTDLDMEIVGIVRSYRTRGGLVLCDLGRYQEATGDRAWGGVRIYFHDRSDIPAQTERLRAGLLAVDPGLEVTSGQGLRREILRIFDQTFSVTTVLLIVALAVASLGITTTLAVLVLERMRQLHTLLAVGASARQVRAMIFWEAVILVAAGEVMGLVCGLILSRILVFDINRATFGWTFVYSLDAAAILPAVPLVLATAMAAALPAARLAFSRPSAEILRER